MKRGKKHMIIGKGDRVQSNDPDDQIHEKFNESQIEQQARGGYRYFDEKGEHDHSVGGSWDNVSYEDRKAILGDRMGGIGGSWSQPPWNGWKPLIGGHHCDIFQKYAQDSDMGFFEDCSHGLALGGHMPLNHFQEEIVSEQYKEPVESTIELELPPPLPVDAEPEQHSNYTQPYSQIQENSVLYQKPFELPEIEYKGSFHKKNKK
jgi:hypothetical protein